MAKSIQVFGFALLLGLVGTSVQPAAADLSAFVALVGFDNDANLDDAPGVGLRWGKSSGVLAGETSLMVARPDRKALGDTESSTAIFYEGRLILNIPVGDVKPFVNVGFGAITILPGGLKAPTGANPETVQALDDLSNTETNQAFSYGVGVRYALNDRIDGRLDLRQYQVFSVKGVVKNAVVDAAGIGDLPRTGGLVDENTVQYSEVSFGVVFRF